MSQRAAEAAAAGNLDSQDRLKLSSFAGDSPTQKLLESLARPLHVDELAVMTGLPVSVINSSLVELELAGLVEELSAGVFQRVS